MFKTLLSGMLTGSIILSSIYVLPVYAQKAEQEKFDAQEIECLALNIYFETRAASLADAAAVSDVVLNRVKSNRYPDTICEVVHQGHQKPSWKNPDKMVMVKNKCQFSWYCDGLSDKPREPESWVDALNRTIVALELYKEGFDISHGSTHYHSKNVKPYWSTTIDYITTIDDHHFYKWGK